MKISLLDISDGTSKPSRLVQVIKQEQDNVQLAKVLQDNEVYLRKKALAAEQAKEEEQR